MNSMPQESQPGDFRIPDHVLLRRIGEGSSGEVWLAQSTINRALHAVKIVRRSRFKDASPYQRELTGIHRFEPISRFHPGFVNILHVGQAEDETYFYYLMELGDDMHGQQPVENPDAYQVKTLDRILQGERYLSVDDALELGLRLSDALSYLHEAGLVHRDIKPANIVYVQGRPKLADIGLVTDVAAAKSFVGTLGYIPPEGPGSRQADIYALGKVLYECLTGLDRQRFPDLPTMFHDSPDRSRFLEVNEIVLKAAHHEREQRYKTAEALHADLTAVHRGGSVIRLRELEAKLGRFKRISRVVALLALLAAAGYLLLHRELRLRDLDRQRAVGALIANGAVAIENGDYAKALQDTAAILPLLGEEKLDAVNHLRYATLLDQIPKLTLLQSLASRLKVCQFVDDDSVLVGMENGRCQIREAATGRVQSEFLGHSDKIYVAAVSSDGSIIASAGQDKTARLWDRRTGSQQLLLRHPGPVTAVAFTPRSEALVTGGHDGVVRFWDVATGQLTREFKAHRNYVTCLTYSHAGNLLATTSQDNTARLWHADSYEQAGEPFVHDTWVFDAQFSPDDNQLLTACEDKTARVWSVARGGLILPAMRHERAVRAARFGPDGRHIFTAGYDGTVRVWDARSGRLVPPILRHSGPVFALDVSQLGDRLVTGCSDGTLRIWNRAGVSVARLLEANAVSTDGEVFTRSNQNQLQVFRMARPTAPVTAVPAPGPIKAMLDQHGRRVATSVELASTNVPVFQVWNAEQGVAVSPPILGRGRSARAELSPSGEILAILHNNSARFVSSASGTLLFPPVVAGSSVKAIAFSADSRLAAIAAGKGVEVIHLDTGRRAAGPFQHELTVEKAVFNHVFPQIVTLTSDNQLRSCYAQIWDLNTSQPVTAKLWHRDGVKDAAWLADGRRLVSVGEDGIAQLWLDGQPSGAPLPHPTEIFTVAITHSPELIVTGDRDGVVRLWDPMSSAPVGPPFRAWSALAVAKPATDWSHVLSRGINGSTVVQPIHAIAFSAVALAEIADVLAGRASLHTLDDEFRTARTLTAEWQRVAAAHPRLFTVSAEDILAWHQDAVQQCEAANLPKAELFHLNEILRSNPGDFRSLSRKKLTEESLRTDLKTQQAR